MPLCGGILVNITGEISSPNFPSEYPNATVCTWTINAPEESQIEIFFEQDFAIENDSSCSFDSIKVCPVEYIVIILHYVDAIYYIICHSFYDDS